MSEEAKTKLFDLLIDRRFFVSEVEEIMECIDIVEGYYDEDPE